MNPYFQNGLALVLLTVGFFPNTYCQNNASEEIDDPDNDPHQVLEEGCPIVAEYHRLRIEQLDGDNWRLPFASINWLAEIGMALQNKSVHMSEITSFCPKIIISDNVPSSKHNYTWMLKFISKLHGEIDLRCSKQGQTKSKFICWNEKEDKDHYMMIAATDHANWILVVRCSPSEPEKPTETQKKTEGMSWAILSKDIKIDEDVVDVIFGLLEGYGFDVDEFKANLSYENCIA